MQVPQKVKERRRRLYTAEEFGQLIGVSGSTVERLERDALSVRARTLRSYLLAMGWRLRVVKDFRRRTTRDSIAMEAAS